MKTCKYIINICIFAGISFIRGVFKFVGIGLLRCSPFLFITKFEVFLVDRKVFLVDN